MQAFKENTSNYPAMHSRNLNQNIFQYVTITVIPCCMRHSTFAGIQWRNFSYWSNFNDWYFYRLWEYPFAALIPRQIPLKQRNLWHIFSIFQGRFITALFRAGCRGAGRTIFTAIELRKRTCQPKLNPM